MKEQNAQLINSHSNHQTQVFYTCKHGHIALLSMWTSACDNHASCLEAFQLKSVIKVSLIKILIQQQQCVSLRDVL